MKRLYLASSIHVTANRIAEDIGNDLKKLKLVFISTAAEAIDDDKKWLNDDKNGLIKAGFNLFDYTITNKSLGEIDKDLDSVDIVHVNGGNSFYLLLQARKSGFDKWIKKAILEKGKIYIGSSAGSMIASPNIDIAKNIDTGVYINKLKTFEGFGLVDFITLPHWGSNYFKSSYLDNKLDVAYKPENKIIILNDYQYVKVLSGTYKIVDVRD